MSTRQSIVDRFTGRNTDDIVLTLLDNMIWPILVLVVFGVLAFVPQTLSSPSTIRLLLWGGASLGLLVLAESLCLLSGHFDLSIGAIAGFSAMFTGMVLGNCPTCWNYSNSAVLGFVLILAIGLAIGLTNGVMISKLGINPFLQTLAFLIIFEGAKTALQTQPVTGLPLLYLQPGSTPAYAIGIVLVVFLSFGVIMRYTRFGQAVYAVGSDKSSAREVGIETDSVIIVVYTISGVLAALAGLLITGFVGIVPPLIGEGLVFQAFAGAVIGGISLFGGRGKVTGALGGVLLIELIQSALDNSTLVGATQIQMINGFVLLIAIVLYTTQDRIRARILASDSS
jgi:ribose/xylose/arabinose/galactoside ABC-type transport system permease subunit